MSDDPPRLCPDHEPFIGNLQHLDDVDHHDTLNAREERARQCPGCYALNDRRLT
jgi:hypothetical protein